MEQPKVTRRSFLHMAVLGMVGGALAACAPKAAPEPTAATAVPEATAVPADTAVAATAVPEPTAAPVAAKAEIRWLDWSGMDDLVKLATDHLKELEPNITVNFEPLGDGWGDKQLTQMVSGTAPDVMTGNDNISYMWAEKEQLLDLQPLVDRDLTPDEVADFVDFMWKGMVYPGNKIRMGMPDYAWIYLYYFNKDAFDQEGVPYPKPGWTLSDYDSYLTKFTKTDANGKVTSWGGLETQGSNIARRPQMWLWMFGGEMVDPSDWTKCVLSSKESKDALDWLHTRMFDTNTLLQSAQQENAGSLEVMVTGKVALVGDGNGKIGGLFGEPPAIKWGIAPPPIGPIGKPAGLGALQDWCIWKGTKSPEGSWALTKVLSMWEGFQVGQAALWGMPPVRKSLLPKFKDAVKQKYPVAEDDQLQPQLDMLATTWLRPGCQFRQQAASEEVLDPVLEQILVTGDADVSALDAVCEQVTTLNSK